MRRLPCFVRAVVAAVVATLCLAAAALHAQEPEPLLRVRFEPSRRVLVGQPVRLHVDLLTPTWFPRPPQFPTLEIPNAVTVMPEESALNLNTSIEGNSYAGLSRSYLIYPQATGEFTLPPAEVVFVYALPNARPSESTRLAFPPVRFEAYIPAEAAGMESFLATTRLSVKQQLEPEPAGLREGDSFRRTITVDAEKTFAMFLPPVDWTAPEGLRVYPDPPRSSDRRTDRGGFIGGERTESAVYVAREAGTYALPEIEVAWWDLTANRLRTETLAAIELEVEANPAAALDKFDRTPEPAEEEAPPETETAAAEAAYAVGAFAVLFLAAWLILGRLRRRTGERTRKQVEDDLFREFHKACAANDPAGAMNRLLAWLDYTNSGQTSTVSEWAAAAGDAELRAQSDVLNRRLYAREGRGARGWDGPAFYRSAAKARQRSHADDPVNKAGALPALNP